MSDNKLVLHPVNPWAILQDPELLLNGLRGLGLVGGGFSHVGELHYKAGPRFRDLVVFREAPAAAAPAPHVSLLETTAEPAFLGASNTQPPACPACHASLADWRSQLMPWQAAKQKYLWACKCGRKAPVQELDWGKTGGVARYSLDLWGIRENEAAPSPELLEALERETFERWRYFYYRF